MLNKNEIEDHTHHNHDHEHSHEDSEHDHHEHSHEHHHHEEDCCSEEHHHHEHSHDGDCCSHEHGGCACESGILDNLEDEEKSKKPYYLMGTGIIIFLIGLYLSKFTNFPLTTLNIANFQIAISSANISIIPFAIVVLIVGLGVMKHGIKSLLHKEVKIEFLVTISTIGAFILGDFTEGASLMLLYFIAEFLEDLALDRSKKSIVNLVKLSPDTGIVKKEGKEIELAIDEIAIGDIVIVKPGDKIPVDGEIIKGSTSVDQASITGESLAVSKTVGDEVYSSTINEEGYIEIKVNKTSENTIFAKIVDLIKESDEKKAKIDLIVDKFAKYYTPLIVGLAILVAFIPPIVFGDSLSQWIYRALVLLVISCPCALVISTPVSMVSAITAGTKNGIIIKGGEYVEELSKIKAILFDKTGTLTEGNLAINKIEAINFDEKELIKIACSIEGKSKHPIAKAFNEYKQENNIDLNEIEDFESVSGKGLIGKIAGETYYIGKKELFSYEINIENDNDKAKTSVYIGDNEKIIGFISLTDKIRDNSAQTIANLKEHNIQTMMLTGDNNETANLVSSEIGLNNYYSNLLPEDKVNKVQEVVDQYKDVAMVGDGVNDTPSLARANVGIAMGMGGADVAVETADIVLMQDNISKISYLINLSKKTMNVVKQNISASLLVKGCLAILGIIGFVSLWQAVLIGDMGLTLIVVANALRISR